MFCRGTVTTAAHGKPAATAFLTATCRLTSFQRRADFLHSGDRGYLRASCGATEWLTPVQSFWISDLFRDEHCRSIVILVVLFRLIRSLPTWPGLSTALTVVPPYFISRAVSAEVSTAERS